MSEDEIITLLKVVKENQKATGVSKNSLMALLYNNPHFFEPELTFALVNVCIQNGYLNVSNYGHESYMLSSSGTLWLRDKIFERNKEDYTHIAEKIANVTGKPKKLIDWGKWGNIAAIVGAIVTVLAFILSLVA